MAHFLRLIALLSLAVWSLSAHALLPQVSRKTLTGAGQPGNQYYYQTNYTEGCNQAIANLVTVWNDGSTGTLDSCTWSGGVVRRHTPSGNNTLTYNFLFDNATLVCPANSTSVSGGCQCNSGYGELNGACAPVGQVECSALTAKSVGSKTWKGDSASFSYCDMFASAGGGHCVVSVSRDITWTDESGQKWSMGSGSYTGAFSASCDGNGTPTQPGGAVGLDDAGTDQQPDNTAAPAPCPEGQAPGEVNGTRICAPMGAETPTTAPSPDTGTKKETNADGTSKETSTTGTTTCKDGKCTTTNTTTVTNRDAAGNVTGTSTTSTSSTQSQSAFCQANAKAAQCAGQGDGKGGEFGGDCASGFRATGDDPILNAMALEQHKRNCQLLATTGDAQTEVAAEMAKTGNQTGNNPNNGTVNIGPGNIDQSDALGGGSCNLNKTVQVRGYTATLPFGDMLCDPLAIFGNLLVAVAMLLAGRIITRG